MGGHSIGGEQMRRGVVIAAAASAIVIAGVPACSHDKSASSTSESSSPASSASVHAEGAASKVKVSIDGKDQNVEGTVSCTEAGGHVNIAIGGSATGIGAVLTDANPPGVTSVALGNVDGTTLAYAQGDGQGEASATKDGNSYKISGTATGVDMKNPMSVVKKPFEIDVTCS